MSWSTSAPSGTLDVRVDFADGAPSEWLPYVEWSADGRRSYSPRAPLLHIAVDVLESLIPFVAVHVRASCSLDAVALATPPPAVARPNERAGQVAELAVPEYSQYVVAGERGWCSPTSLAMQLAFAGFRAGVEETARAVYDDSYGGTGNWAFNVAHASTRGTRAFVAYLRDLAHATLFLENGIPLALSFAWQPGELPGAPLEQSAGHIAVLRGFDVKGDPIVNDPAHDPVRCTYPRAQFEALWQRAGGVAFVVAGPSSPDPVALANA